MKIKCPICQNEYELERDSEGKLPGTFPFCSNRCKMMDLGAWLDSSYKIESDIKDADLEED